MWIALTLLSSLGAAGVGLTLKPTLSLGDALTSTIAYRAVGGALLLGAAAWTGLDGPAGMAYAKTVAVVIPFELVGTLAMTLALRSGNLSLVQPLFGVLPVVVMLGGAVLLGERPTGPALAGVGLVALGVYGLGLDGGGGPLAPLRAIAREPAGRWTMVAVAAWTVTTVGHKSGIAAVGALPWAATLALGSALSLTLAAPLLARHLREHPRASAPRVRWGRWVAACGALYAVQQIGLQLALRDAPVGYVTALGATGILLAVAGGLAFLGEQVGRWRLGGAGLVTAGAVLVALYG
jgi:drug/metabolite transporter (DMT)-like permease